MRLVCSLSPNQVAAFTMGAAVGLQQQLFAESARSTASKGRRKTDDAV